MVAAGKTRANASFEREIALLTVKNAQKAVALVTIAVSLVTNVVSSLTGVISLVAGVISLITSAIAPVMGAIAPVMGAIALVMGAIALVTSAVAPVTSEKPGGLLQNEIALVFLTTTKMCPDFKVRENSLTSPGVAAIILQASETRSQVK